ncbi:glutaredoxin 3 [Candidatus Peregrinibacteria bacterium]|nr:glutaredoxin 3 [Candidatus Peregrinibacteria bacterium]
MSNVVVYTKSYCPYSKNCKEFLENKGVAYTEKMIDGDTNLENEMLSKSDHRADTPQVFINGHHIGSFDDLKALDAVNKLDEMLNS